MSEPLPSHIGGYQCLVDDETMRHGDIFVEDGKPVRWVEGAAGCAVSSRPVGMNVYRRIPVAKQGGDPQIWAVEEKRIRESGLAELTRAAAEGPPTETANAHCATGGYMPTDAATRKRIPIATGFCDYFPRAMAAVAAVSLAGNEQHNPGKPLHWDRSKSGDEADALMRHFLERGKVDSDGQLHSAKLAWRAMANLEKELEGKK